MLHCWTYFIVLLYVPTVLFLYYAVAAESDVDIMELKKKVKAAQVS